MNRAQSNLEKLLYAVQIIIGAFVAYLNTSYPLKLMNIEAKVFDNYWVDFLFIHTLKKFHIMFIIGLLLIIGGVLLLRSKKWGWATSFSAWIAAFSITIWVDLFQEKDASTIHRNPLLESAFWITLLICFLPIVILSLKYIRKKYKIHKKDWVFVGVLLSLLLADKILL